jgi:hypothetical protein
MKSIILSLSLALAMLSSLNTSAQGGSYDYFNVGVGVSGWGIPIYAGVDFTVDKRITVGGMVSAQRKVQRSGFLNNDLRWVHTIIGISGNANYHFLEPGDEFDVYAGASIGYYVWSTRLRESVPGFNGVYEGDGSGGFGVGFQVGGRYKLDNGIILHGEFGGGTVFSSGRIGVSFPL